MSDLPTRYQRSRKKGSRLPDGVVCVTRPSSFGNPFSTAAKFRKVLTALSSRNSDGIDSLNGINPSELARMAWICQNVRMLRGKDLACWCAIGKPCHADVLIELSNQEVKQ